MGEGRFKRISENASDPTQVLIEHEQPLTNEQLEANLRLNWILRELFPKIYPDIYRIRHNNGQTAMIAERVPHDPDHSAIQGFIHKLRKDPTLQATTDEQNAINSVKAKINRPDVQEFISRMASAGISHEIGPQNFIFSEDESFRFVDMEDAFISSDGTLSLTFDPNLLNAAINALEPPNKNRALKYFNELLSFCQAGGASLKNYKVTMSKVMS